MKIVVIKFSSEYDPKKFIAFQMREDTHPIYTWNSTAKAFITNSNFVGSNVTHGTDSTGRFWTIQNPAKGELNCIVIQLIFCGSKITLNLLH